MRSVVISVHGHIGLSEHPSRFPSRLPSRPPSACVCLGFPPWCALLWLALAALRPSHRVPPRPAGLCGTLDIVGSMRTMRPGFYHRDEEMSGLFAGYEEYKSAYRDTGQQCAAQGITFFSFMIDAHGGGISPSGRRLSGDLVKESPASQHLEPAQVALRMVQRISCSM